MCSTSSRFQQLLRDPGTELIVTCELAPPKGVHFERLLEQAQALQGLAQAVNITDGQGGNLRMNSAIAAHVVESQTGLETICQLTCRDRNSIGLQADILGALGLGLRNFLALSGDKSDAGDNPQAHNVFELSTDQLLEIFLCFGQGQDLAGNSLDDKITDTCLGAAAHPGLPDLPTQAKKMKARIEQHGVAFFQTQIVYDLEQLKRFLDSLEEGNITVPVLIGLTPLKSLRMAQFMNEKIFGVTVPEGVLKRLSNTSEPQEEGLQISLELVQALQEYGRPGTGVHLMPIGQESRASTILQRIRKGS